MDRDASGQQTQGDTLFLDRDGEVIPAGNPGIGPVVDPRQIGPAYHRPERVGKAGGPGWTADLVGDDADFGPLPQETQYSQDEVVPARGVYPRRPHHQGGIAGESLDGLLAGPFARAIDIDRPAGGGRTGR